MSIRDRLSGNEAIATAMRQINPDVFAMFPITPSTEIPQYFAQYVADGKEMCIRDSSFSVPLSYHGFTERATCLERWNSFHSLTTFNLLFPCYSV